MTELRKQLLVWRTVKPEQQQEYILRGRAHVRDQAAPVGRNRSRRGVIY